MPPDPRPDKRIRNPQLLRALHGRWRECAICGNTDRLSLHHVLKHPRNDEEANLIMLCGDGVRGCHGAIEAHHGPTVRKLIEHILLNRADTVEYLVEQMGMTPAIEWIHRQTS